MVTGPDCRPGARANARPLTVMLTAIGCSLTTFTVTLLAWAGLARGSGVEVEAVGAVTPALGDVVRGAWVVGGTVGLGTTAVVAVGARAVVGGGTGGKGPDSVVGTSMPSKVWPAATTLCSSASLRADTVATVSTRSHQAGGQPRHQARPPQRLTKLVVHSDIPRPRPD